jgi:hypothetical protein
VESPFPKFANLLMQVFIFWGAPEFDRLFEFPANIRNYLRFVEVPSLDKVVQKHQVLDFLIDARVLRQEAEDRATPEPLICLGVSNIFRAIHKHAPVGQKTGFIPLR